MSLTSIFFSNVKSHGSMGESNTDLIIEPITDPIVGIKKTEPAHNIVNNSEQYISYFDNSSINQENSSEHSENTDNTIMTFSASIDHVIGAFAIFLMMIGVIGHILSIFYFWKRRRKTIHDFLYLVISVVDALTSAACFPVIVSLLNSRSEMLFNNVGICYSWPVSFYLLIRVSMLLVILVSVTRTVVIARPSKHNSIKLEPKHVVLGMMAYSIMLVTIDLAFLLTGNGLLGKGITYVKRVSFCEIFTEYEDLEKGEDLQSEWSTRLYAAIFNLGLILPCLVVFVSFSVSVIALSRRKGMQSKDEKKFRFVSITIGLFTALFLFCYLPLFVLQVVYFTSYFIIRLPILEINGFKYYGHLLVQFFLPLLNATIKPYLFMLRMPQYRKWLIHLLKMTHCYPAEIVKSSDTKGSGACAVTVGRAETDKKVGSQSSQIELTRLLKQ